MGYMAYGASRARSRARRARYECECKCRMVLFIQSDSHSCTTRCDAMFLSIPFYKMKVILLQYFDVIVSKKTVFVLKKEENSITRKLRKIFRAPSENRPHDPPSSNSDDIQGL